METKTSVSQGAELVYLVSFHLLGPFMSQFSLLCREVFIFLSLPHPGKLPALLESSTGSWSGFRRRGDGRSGVLYLSSKAGS